MTKILSIITCLVLCFYSPFIAFAEEKIPQTLEEITADLKTKKADLEPFDEKKVKVDIESLGLDAIDEKPIIKIEEAKQVENKVEPPAPIIKEEKAESLTSKFQKIINNKKEILPKKIEQELVTEKPLPQIVKPNTTKKYINSKKKLALRKRIEEERNKIHSKKQFISNEKKQREKLQKLKALRKEYLIKITAEETEQEELFEEETKIIPHKKDINKFADYEPPAIPILNRYRTSDNIHIPLILSKKEKIQILFDAISNRYDFELFNAAYKNVEDPNVKNTVGDTALTYATLIQNHGAIASILTKGADPNMPNNLGFTPIHIAIELSDVKSLNLLVENKADIKDYIDAFGRTYLMYAVRVGFLPAVELFIRKGADVNAIDNDGFTALAIAYRYKQEVIIKYLLLHGAKTWVERPYNPQEQSLIKELENRWKH